MFCTTHNIFMKDFYKCPNPFVSYHILIIKAYSISTNLENLGASNLRP